MDRQYRQKYPEPKIWRLRGVHLVREALGERRTPNGYDLAILQGLATRHVYAGTVAAAEVDRRRVRNRVAAAQRRINRGTR